MEYREVDEKVFYDSIKKIEFRDDDEKEAKAFGCESVEDCLKKVKGAYSRYFLFIDNSSISAVCILGRNGNISFFVSKRVDNHMAFIRSLKELADKVVKCCGAITTRTATWYDEALRINRLVGFKLVQRYDGYGFYVKE